jgi:hypothetical protein
MPFHKKYSRKMRAGRKQARRSSRVRRGGDEPKNDDYDIEMGPRPDSPEQQVASIDADDMEKGLTKFSPEPTEPGEEMLGGKKRSRKSKKHHKKKRHTKTRKGKKHSRRYKK